MSDKKPHIILRFLKALVWTLFSLILILVLIRLSLKTKMVHNLAKNQVVSITNKNINGSLSIGDINGDLWNDFEVSDITVMQEDTLFSLDSLSVQYHIWSLLKGSFNASQIHLSSLNAFLLETGPGKFNVQDLLITENDDEITPDSSTPTFKIQIDSLGIENSSIFVQSPSYLPDSTLIINQLNATAGLRLFDDISVSLSSLSFQITEGRLPEPIAVRTSATYQDQLVTLNQLVIETGRSIIHTKGFANLETNLINSETEGSPISFKDIQPYLDTSLPEEEVQLTLKAGGNPDSFQLELQANGRGFENLLLSSELSFSETPTLKKFGLQGKNLDIAYFTNDSVDAEISDFQFTMEGTVSENYADADITWGFTFNTIRYESYTFETLLGSGTLKDQKLLAKVQLRDGNDMVNAYPEINGLFAESPSWQLPVHVSNVNPGWWLKDPELNGNLNFRANLNGSGFDLSEERWNFEIFLPVKPRTNNRSDALTSSKPPTLAVDTLLIGNQKFSDLNISGTISKDSIHAIGFIQLIDSKFTFTAAVADYLREIPSYSYKIRTTGFDARDIAGFEDFPTTINMTANGSGRYFDPEMLQLSSHLLIDSSYVNGASFNLLDVSAEYEDNILSISESELRSEIIEGFFSGRNNLSDPSDPNNEFSLDMKIKNLQPLAPWVGAEIFNATGQIKGDITEIQGQNLQFDGNIELNDVYYDTLYSAQSINGKTKISIGDSYGYDFTLDIIKPTYAVYNLQDIQFSSNGISSADSIAGNFNLEIVSDDAGKISQSGSYNLHYETLRTHLIWQKFDFQTPARLLSLQSPFNVTYQNSAIQTDTLRLISESSTFLNIAVPYADSLKQQFWIRGQDFDFGVIQDIIFDERFVDGILSGYIEFAKAPSELTGNGAFNITDLSYKNTNVDLLVLDFSIHSERLTANLNVSMEGEDKITGSLDLPFIAADPSTYDDSFYDEPVFAQLVINPVHLSEFENLMKDFDITGTQGVLSFNGDLAGTVREPNLAGIFKLGDPTLSGIKIDSAFARFQYHHLEEKITAVAEIDARGQRAASIDAELPVSINFLNREMIMPDASDSLRFNFFTNDFNMSVFNDFLDKQYMSRLRGSLNANILVNGTKEKLNPTGYLRLSNAEVSVPIAGITLSKINSDFSFTDSGLRLNNLRASSGSGSFSANGDIELEGMTPTKIDIAAKATRFRLANTSDYNLTVDLDSRLTGKPYKPKASGVLTIKNGFVFLRDFGERSVETVELKGEEASSFSPYDSLAIEMQFVIERNFLVRNRRYLDLEMELTGELDAQKQTDGELQLFGVLNAERGYARPLGKMFTLDEGTFTFSGPLTEPDLNIRTSYIPQTTQKQSSPITLYYIIEGNA
ncbi:MAG: translocation/assembly module TamB domain-containing protein, partial [Balneolaceae bacterium]